MVFISTWRHLLLVLNADVPEGQPWSLVWPTILAIYEVEVPDIHHVITCTTRGQEILRGVPLTEENLSFMVIQNVYTASIMLQRCIEIWHGRRNRRNLLLIGLKAHKSVMKQKVKIRALTDVITWSILAFACFSSSVSIFN